jgi:hypothetical protein
MSRRLAALLLALALVPFSACGKSGPKVGPTTQEVSSDLAALVPDDAIGMLYVPSLDALEKKLRTIVGTFDPGAAAQVNLDAALADVPPPLAPVVKRLDRTRPFAVTVSFVNGEPSPAFVVPVTDVKAVQAEIGSANVAAGPGYVLLGAAGVPAHGKSQIAKVAPAGDLAVRIDLARAVEAFRPMIDQTLGQISAQGGEAGAGLEGMVGGFRTFVDSAEWLDLGFRLDGTKVAIDGEFRAKAGTPLAKGFGGGDVAPVADRLPKDLPVSMAISFDAASLIEWQQKMVEPMLEQFDAAQREAMTRMLDGARELTGLMGNEHAMGFGVGPEGLEAVFVSAAKDPKAMLAKTRDLYSQMGGVMGPDGPRMEVGPPTNIDGVEVLEIAIGLPAEAAGSREAAAFLGPDGLRIRLAAVDGRVVGAMGPQSLMQSAIASAKKPGKAATGLAEALRQGGGKPAFALRIEGRELARQILGRVKAAFPDTDIPDVPAGKPAPFLVHLSSEGRVYRGGLSVDLGAWKEVLEPIFSSMVPRPTDD